MRHGTEVLMRKIVSYALFGSEPIYYQGLDTLVLAHHAIFKGFELRIHHDSSTKAMPQFSFLQRLHDAGKLTLVHFEENKALTRSMMWRFLPLFEPGLDYLFTRDIDSLPLVRDRAMAEEFIETGLVSHNICDYFGHLWWNVPLMGGCMGFKVAPLLELLGVSNFEELMRFSGHDDNWFIPYGNDEVFLTEKVWPLVKGKACLHLTKDQRDCPDAKVIREVRMELATGVPERIMSHADSLCPNVCSKGWKFEEARLFYKENGDPEILSIIENTK